MISKVFIRNSLIIFFIAFFKLWRTTFLGIVIFLYFKIKKYINGKHKKGFKEIKPSIMVILGSGGHTWEMINVLSRLNWKKYLPIYIIGYSDFHSLNDIIFFENKLEREYFYERIIRPKENWEKTYSLKVLLKSIYCFFKSFKLIYQHKPDYILANGPSICVPIIICGWFLKKLGYINIKLIYIESAARVNNLSISAKIIKNIVDDMFGFWKPLCDSFHLKPLNSSEYFKYININNNNDIKKLNINESNNKSILVTVGTTHFEKLMKFVFDENFHKKLLINGFSKLFIQIGNYQLEKNNTFKTELKIEIFNFIPSYQFNNLIKNCNVIISHGGAGTLIQSILKGKKPIAIPNELVNENHQTELIDELYKRGYIFKCEIEKLLDYLSNNNISDFTFGKIDDKIELNDLFLDSIGFSKINEYIPVMKNKLISIVIPCIYKDIFRLKNLLISINKFVSKDLYDKIYIIISDDDFYQISHFILSQNEINQLKEIISFIKDSELIPLNNLSNKYLFFLKSRNGWFKQQLLKLAIAYKINVKIKFYLILDSDCLFINTFNSSHVFLEKNNSILSFLQEEDIYVHDKWWQGSAKLLGITKPYMDSLKSGIGVTPQILSVDIVKKLCEFIETKSYKEKWYSILWSNRITNYYPIMIWTEYTLYYLFAKRAGILNKYHIIKKNCFCDYNKSVWELHESFEWNPLYNTNSSIVVFQSNTSLSHLIPKVILSQFDITKDFISCIMFIEKKNLYIKDQNSLLMSINCFIKQIFKKEKRELIIFCDKDNIKIISNLIKIFNDENIFIIEINKEKNIFENIKNNNNIKGNYIALWPINCWSSPYRLSVQYDFIKEQKINKCYISPYIKAYPEKNTFLLSENSNINIDNIELKNSLFSKRIYFSNYFDIKIEAVNEPSIFIEINDEFSLKNQKGQKDAIKYLQKRNSLSLFYELIRLSNPFIYNSSLINLRKNRRIYIISSELEFIPVIGGINTFLRVIISELQQSKIHLGKNTEFIFIGIKTNSSTIIPKIKDVSFKFFSTDNSMKFNSLNNYFKSFGKLSLIFNDLQKFGKEATEWIEKDSIPGDICITTIVYELNKDSLIALNKKGVKLIHTVHSLVPLKTINNLKKANSSSLYLKEKIGVFLLFKILRFDEYSIRKYSNNFFINKIIPKLGKFAFDIEDFIMNLAQIIIVPSKKLSNITANLYYKNKHKIRYIPWGLPEKEILGEPFIYYNKKIISNFKINDYNQKIKCLALCKIIPQKGIDVLLDSLIFIQNINPIFAEKIELNICGDMSYMRDDKFKQLLDEKIKKLDKIKVKFKGWVSGQPKIDILTNSDLFLLPSLIEPFGFCVLEAMKAGLPIVSFNTEGPDDIITSKFGRLVKISDYDTMTKDFGISIIDICQSEKFNELRDSSAYAIKNWGIKKLIDNILFN